MVKIMLLFTFLLLCTIVSAKNRICTAKEITDSHEAIKKKPECQTFLTNLKNDPKSVTEAMGCKCTNAMGPVFMSKHDCTGTMFGMTGNIFQMHKLACVSPPTPNNDDDCEHYCPTVCYPFIYCMDPDKEDSNCLNAPGDCESRCGPCLDAEDEESLAAGKNIVSNEPISQKYKYFGCGVVFITCFAALFGYYNKTKRNEDMIGLLENFNEEV